MSQALPPGTATALERLRARVGRLSTLLCVGLDTEPARLPGHLPRTVEGVLTFNRAIIEATAPFAAAYKINTAFYEGLGPAGWQALADTLTIARQAGAITIADAKRGDIGNTASQYAKAFFETLEADALTVNPLMGLDTLEAYLAYPDRMIFVLACTSNPGFADFEDLELAGGGRLYEQIVRRCEGLAAPSQLHYVAGATRPEQLARVRALAPQAVLLVPGVGAQGGDLAQVCQQGLTPEGLVLINASRSILYADASAGYAQAAAAEAARMQGQMEPFLRAIGR